MGKGYRSHFNRPVTDRRRTEYKAHTPRRYFSGCGGAFFFRFRVVDCNGHYIRPIGYFYRKFKLMAERKNKYPAKRNTITKLQELVVSQIRSRAMDELLRLQVVSRNYKD